MQRVKRNANEKSSYEGENGSYSALNPFRWVQFLTERAPPIVFFLLASGPCLSGLQIVEGRIEWIKFLFALFGELVLLLTVRIMDDVKDYDLDCSIHPERPLPRGLLKYDDVVVAINLVLAAMILYAVILGVWFSPSVGITFGIQVFYSFLMYVEFGIGQWLEPRVLLYALTHQVSIYFGAWFICALAGAPWYSWSGFLLGSVAFSGFFTYEICRKLDPTLPLRKGTYLVVYGKWVTFFVVCVTVLVGVISSYFLHINWLLWPMEAIMILSLLVLFVIQKPVPNTKTHKPVEVLGIFYILLHMWAGFIASFW